MGILFNKKWTLYKYTRDNTTNISSYSNNWITFACNIQPLSEKDWIEWGIMFKQKKMYCRYDNITVWDKVVIDWITYIIDSFQKRDGLKSKHNKAFISMSEWI